MEHTIQYNASCFCGDVQFTLNGHPEAMAYCHCESCRKWSAAPLSAFTLWKPESINFIKGQNNIASYEKNPSTGDLLVISKRQWCKTCGGHVFTEHPTMGLVDVPSAVIKKFTFTPVFHVHYQETVQPMHDGLSKYKDLPAEAGGSGLTLAE